MKKTITILTLLTLITGTALARPMPPHPRAPHCPPPHHRGCGTWVAPTVGFVSGLILGSAISTPRTVTYTSVPTTTTYVTQTTVVRREIHHPDGRVEIIEERR